MERGPGVRRELVIDSNMSVSWMQSPDGAAFNTTLHSVASRISWILNACALWSAPFLKDNRSVIAKQEPQHATLHDAC